MKTTSINKKITKKPAKPYDYLFKWYAIGYIFIGFVILSLNYEKWFK